MAIRNTGTIATLVACVFTPAALAKVDAAGKQWQFDVSLDGKPIGVHTFELQQDGPRQTLTSEASFDVKVLFITAFRYRHQNTEVWKDGCLASIDASTDSNGKKLEVRGAIGDDGFELQSSEGSKTLPSCVRSFAYWKPELLDAPRLLNSQTGVYEDVSVTLEGADQVPVAGDAVDALRYRLSAEAGDITLWYSREDNVWLGLEAPAKGGRTLRYEPVALPESANPEAVIARSDRSVRAGSE